jgi:Zn-dependent peptidase ImmA (M78 family)
MNTKVQFLSAAEIEAAAEVLLAEYGRQETPITEPPVPIEEILEFHLGLSLGLGDLRGMLGFDDVIGALWVEHREVIIDQSLDPSARPHMEGRYRFTVGHEVGHWVLHRLYLDRSSVQPTLFDQGRAAPSVICRTSQAKERAEWQADRLSAAALMPRWMIVDEWRRRHGGREPITLAELREREHEILEDRLLDRGRGGMGRTARDKALFKWVARPLAEAFGVSSIAMRIRLEQLGLLIRHQSPDLFSAAAGRR